MDQLELDQLDLDQLELDQLDLDQLDLFCPAQTSEIKSPDIPIVFLAVSALTESSPRLGVPLKSPT